MSEPIEGEVVGTELEVPAAVHAVARQNPLSTAPAVTADELVERLDLIREAQQRAMVRDVDYGVIPGTGSKPTLLKPGAEKLAVLFQLDIQVDNELIWGTADHLTVVSKATAFHAPTGVRLGFGEGICTTREDGYRWRQQNRLCPACGQDTIIKGKEQYGGGWLCWQKKGGCGAKFQDGDQAIEGQPIGRTENDDLASLWNTVVKMAAKRAKVDAVLSVTGASALFTQDVEDNTTGAPAPWDETAPPASPPPAQSRPASRPAAPTPEPEGDPQWAAPEDKRIGNRDASAAYELLSKAKPTRTKLAEWFSTVVGQPVPASAFTKGRVRDTLGLLSYEQVSKLVDLAIASDTDTAEGQLAS